MVEVRVCSVGEVRAPGARRFTVDGHRLCVVHIGDDWYVIGDECSHADYSLSEGDLWVDEREIECPKHGSTFSLTTGEPQTLPATRPVPVYPVRIDGDDVLVTLGPAAPASVREAGIPPSSERGPSGPGRRPWSGKQ